MKERITVQMIGAPIGVCGGDVEDVWRKAARLVGSQLERYFGNQIDLQYFDLFDTNCPTLPPNTQLPLVLIEGQVLSSGGKLSTPALRRHLEGLGLVREEHIV